MSHYTVNNDFPQGPQKKGGLLDRGWKWIKEHPVETAVSAVVVTGCAYLGYQSLKSKTAPVPQLPTRSLDLELPDITPNSRNFYGRCGTIRNLPDGWSASPEKVAEALALGIELLEGQTWVKESFPKD